MARKLRSLRRCFAKERLEYEQLLDEHEQLQDAFCNPPEDMFEFDWESAFEQVRQQLQESKERLEGYQAEFRSTKNSQEGV
jgi:hypothetical protein